MWNLKDTICREGDVPKDKLNPSFALSSSGREGGEGRAHSLNRLGRMEGEGALRETLDKPSITACAFPPGKDSNHLLFSSLFKPTLHTPPAIVR